MIWGKTIVRLPGGLKWLWNSLLYAFISNRLMGQHYAIPEIRKSGLPEIRISGIPKIRISGNLEIRESGLLEFRNSGIPEIWNSGYPNIRITDTYVMLPTIIFNYRSRFQFSLNYFCNVFPPMVLEIISTKGSGSEDLQSCRNLVT